jgi:hypothetical protein
MVATVSFSAQLSISEADLLSGLPFLLLGEDGTATGLCQLHPQREQPAATISLRTSATPVSTENIDEILFDPTTP